MDNENLVLASFRKAVEIGIEGSLPGFASASDLAEQYSKNPKYRTSDERVDALIRWQASKSGAIGFLTGAAGALNWPVAVGAMMASFGPLWIIQARMAAAIAELYGHDVRDDQVRIAVMWCVLGDMARAGAEAFAVSATSSVAKSAIESASKETMKALNRPFGARLITKAGEKSLINLTRLVPILGGVVGGTMDAGACWGTGKLAKRAFGVDAATTGG